MRLVPGNRITLLTNGIEYFPALLHEIDAATSDVRIESYIFDDDPTGNRVIDALMRAAQRGVAVKLLLDGFGSREFPKAQIARMRDAGVAVLFYRPDLFSLRRNRLRRMHRKIALIDGRVGFVGGINIIDDFSEINTGFPRYDYCVKVEGPLLAEIYHAVYRLWRGVAWQHLRRRLVSDIPRPISRGPVGDMVAAFVVRDNVRHRHDIENMYLEGIGIARREIVIASAYFLPGWRFRHAIKEAARRGVRVVLLLQGWSDHPILKHATRAFYESMLDSGIEIYEYTKSEMHAKVAVVDARWAAVGSSNLDPFSLLLSREANVAVFDEGLAVKLRASLEMALKEGATPIPRMLWKHRPLPVRLLNWFGYGVARVAIGIMGVQENWLHK